MDTVFSEIIIPGFLSLKIAGSATIIALLWGGCFAWLLFEKYSFWATLFESLISLPLVLPPTVTGFYLLTVLGRTGAVGHLVNGLLNLDLIFTPIAAVIAASVAAIPIVYKSCKSFLKIVPLEVLEAARLDGATEIQLLFQIRLPLAAQGVLAGIMLAFLRALGEFGATFMVAGNIPGKTQTLSLSIWGAIMSGDLIKAHLIAALLAFLCIAITCSVQKLDRHLNDWGSLTLTGPNLIPWKRNVS